MARRIYDNKGKCCEKNVGMSVIGEFLLHVVLFLAVDRLL